MERAPYACEIVARTGRELYGPRWQTDLSRALALSARTLQRIAEAADTGRPYPIEAATMDRLAGVVRERERALKQRWMDIKRRAWAA